MPFAFDSSQMSPKDWLCPVSPPNKIRVFAAESYTALLLSLGLHFLLFHAGALTLAVHKKNIVEIDITNMGHLGMPGTVRKAAPPAPPPPPDRA